MALTLTAVPLQQSMWFRYLTASTACAALLGLAVSGFVRTHCPEVLSVLAPKASEVSPVDEAIQGHGESPSVVDLAPEGVTSEEARPTSLLPPKEAKGIPACARPALSHNPVRNTFARELARGIRKLAERRWTRLSVAR